MTPRVVLRLNKTMPQEQDISAGEFELIKDVFRTLVKTIKTFNQYPKDNPVYQRFASELYGKFGSVLKSGGELAFDVGPDSLSREGDEVYRSEERTDNIALSLYTDGIRRLSFGEGLTMTEMVDFIDVLRLTPRADSLVDDIVTVLWEKNFEHIGYTVVPELAEGNFIPEEFLISSEEVEEGPYGASYSDVTVKPVALGLKTEPLTGDEEMALKEELFDVEEKSSYLSAVGLLLEILQSERDISEFSALADNTGKAMDALLERGDIQSVMQVLRRLREVGRAVPEPDKRKAILNVINRAGNIENLRRLFSGGFDIKDVSRYILLLSRAVIPRMIELLGEIQERKQRRFLCDILIEIGRQDIGVFSEALLDKRWFLVRNIVMILGMMKNPSVVKPLEKVLKHPDARVRKEAVRALEGIQSPETKGAFFTLLADPEPTVRVGSLRALKRFKDPDVFIRLKEGASREELKKKAFSEKKELLEALALSGGERAFPLLAELFRKKGLIEKAEVTELRACAAYALGCLGMPEARGLLEKEADSRKPLLREACIKALKECGSGAKTDS